MRKQALIIVHANGCYDKQNNCHRVDKGANVDSYFYDTLIKEIESDRYDAIMYKINLYNCSTEDEIEKAINTDPILSRLDDKAREKIKIIREGAFLASKFNNYSERMELEDSMVAEGYVFVFCGLYYDACVRSHAASLKGRHPDAIIQLPKGLSRYSSELVRKREEQENLCDSRCRSGYQRSYSPSHEY